MKRFNEATKRKEKEDLIKWLKHQYYDLGRSIQDIADDQDVSMITVRKVLDKIESTYEKLSPESTSTTFVSQFKDEKRQPIPSISEKREEKSKVVSDDQLQPIPIILKKREEKPVKTCPHCGQELSLEAKFCVKCGEKVEELQPIPLITDEKIEKPVIVAPQMKTEELQPILSISVKKKEKPKDFSYICEFCGYKLNKKAIICPQCGTKIKKK